MTWMNWMGRVLSSAWERPYDWWMGNDLPKYIRRPSGPPFDPIVFDETGAGMPASKRWEADYWQRRAEEFGKERGGRIRDRDPEPLDDSEDNDS